MEILPLYKVIVGLQGCVYKIDSLYGGSLKLEDRDFPSYLSSLSKRFSNLLAFSLQGVDSLLSLMVRNEGSYLYLYYSTFTMNGEDYLYPRVEINSLECSTHSRSLYTLLLPSILFHKVLEGSTHLQNIPEVSTFLHKLLESSTLL